MADGDGRYLLNMVEQIVALPRDTPPLDTAALSELLSRRAALYDKDREEHYNLISALHKSLRGSDPDAALYWFARMLNGGEDPRYIARRLVRFAAEDIGMADPNALTQALAGWETYERLGSPEGELAIAQVVVYLGTAPKSNAVYTAFGQARAAAKNTGSLMPPAHILNAPTKLMKQLGYGAGYEYDHQAEDAFSGQNYFPDGMDRVDVLPAEGPRLRTRNRPPSGILGGPESEAVASSDLNSRRSSSGLNKSAHTSEPMSPRTKLIPHSGLGQGWKP